ncbi:IS110 family transposase [Micromonospora sp. NBC_00860]|uniref:IS110 family transposase n=1 Tax=Micromonospora sp. NBC_00860 TaxID=2975980 RepID=UPI003869C4E7|nr:IS110 family transposase [Micromonospora sp. NBC_00860]WSZ78397.1 IS110 family transposase [Micromonospora sp. NBC_00860]
MSDRVVIGMDPHKRSATIEVMTSDETIVGGGRFDTDRDGYAAMTKYAKQWPNRVWAIEGCQGIGRHIANRLLADGEQVVDVPPKLSARARVFATGQGRKTDATDAHSIALVGTRMAGLRPVVNDEQLALLRILIDRRRSLGVDHTRIVSQLHQLLLELIPGGAKKSLSAAQAKALLAKVRPRDTVGKARRRVAAELISDLERVYQRTKDADKELKELVASTGTTLMDLHGIGPSGAARLLVEVGDITRFPNRAHFASWNGTAPIDASSGEQVRHRLSRAGNRQINRVLHIMATVQLRNPTEGRAYFDRKKASGKTSMEALRALKRRLSDIVYRCMINDAVAATAAGPGGQRGTTTDSSVTSSHPQAGSSEKSLPGPAKTQLRTPRPALS